jgi:glycosyltransferase involved in cell wall biosynthesis
VNRFAARLVDDQRMKLAFLTSTPLNIHKGSGTFNGIVTLARALRAQGVAVDFLAPTRKLPVYSLERIWFNHTLRRVDFSSYDATVGFDMDGYWLPVRQTPHIASIKGVIRDEANFESGLTRWTMLLQAACERRHVKRAARVIVTSAYAARRVREFYGPPAGPVVIPELIDLKRRLDLLRAAPTMPDPFSFTVLCVCRLVRRKRVELLLKAAALLRPKIPGLAVRIVGQGPERERLRSMAETMRLQGLVAWLGDISDEEVAGEYRRANVFCLPSVQEGFGIVFLEAMAAGLPIVAARASSVPEVLPQGLLVDPESADSLADGLARLHGDPDLREWLVAEGRERVTEFDAPRIARRFLDEVFSISAARPAGVFSSGDGSTTTGPGIGG